MDPELEAVVARLVDAVTSTDGTYSDAMDAAGDLLDTHVPEANDDIIARLTPAILAPDVRRAGIAATTCGAIVERGGDARHAVDAVLTRMDDLLSTIERYIVACRDHFQNHVVSEHDCDICAADDTETEIMSAPVRAVVREAMPDGEDAWLAFDLFCRPMISILLRAPDRRREVAPHLAGRFEVLSQFQGGAYFAFALCSVLDDHPILVIHPEEGRAFDVTINGVVENHQLQVLLAHALIGSHFEGEPPTPEAVTVASGTGPARAGDIYTAPWDLFQWTVLRDDGTMPDGYFDTGGPHIIWNEGVPADIGSIDGRRVLLLGRPAYIRSFTPARMFEHLQPSLSVDRVYTEAEVADLVERIAQQGQQGQSK